MLAFDPTELLQIAFPKWKDEEGGRVQVVATGGKQGKKRNVIIVPRDVVRVGQDRLVLLAAMTPASDTGEPQVAHGTPSGLAAYTFKPGKNGWQLVKRQEPFDSQGFDGRAKMDIVSLTSTTQAVHVAWGSCWQGRCVDLFALYAIGADGVKPQPLVQQKIKGSNVYSRPDCVDRLGGLLSGMVLPDGRDEKMPPGRCYAVEGRWEIPTRDSAASTPGTLTLHFKGAMSPATKQGSQPAQRIDQVMKFEFRGGRYVPVSGSNPVPDA